MAVATRKSTRLPSALLSWTRNACKMFSYYIVIITCITSHLLTVNAIRCHQCNSHKNEDCIRLRLNTPHAPRDDQFLAECVKQPVGERAFCRKTVLTLETTGQTRVVRDCGWIQDHRAKNNNSCFTISNVGYKQLSCVCNEDGCNGSSALHISRWSVLLVTAVSVVLAYVLVRY